MQKQQKEQVKSQFKGFLTEIDSKFMELQGGTFAYLETGEFFTKTEHDKYLQAELERYKVEVFATINQAAGQATDIINEQSLIINKKKEKPKYKKLKLREKYDGGNFNIVYTNRLEEIQSMKLSNNEKLTYYVLRDYVQFPTNCVCINDIVPSIKDLEPLIGLTERSIVNVLKLLEQKNLIKRVQSGHKKAIYMNPEYYASGKELEIETLKLFGLLECDNEKINSYL